MQYEGVNKPRLRAKSLQIVAWGEKNKKSGDQSVDDGEYLVNVASGGLWLSEGTARVFLPTVNLDWILGRSLI